MIHKKKIIVLSFIIIFINNLLFYTQENNDTMVKRKISILPFYNESKITEYNHISNIISDTLFSKLRDEENFKLIEINEDDIKIKSFLKEKYISDDLKIIKIALQLSSDVIIVGKYKIINEIINIEVNVYDIIEDSYIINENISSKIDIDIYQNIDNLAQKISDKMKVIINIVGKDYYEERLKKIENKLKEQPEEIIDIEGKILIINSQFDQNKYNERLDYAIKELLKPSFNLDRCELFLLSEINNYDNLFDIKSVLTEAERNDFKYIILYTIKEVAKKPNRVIFKIVKVSTHGVIIGKKFKTLKFESLNKDMHIKTVLQNTDSKSNKLILFQRGTNFTIGLGLYSVQTDLTLLNNNFAQLSIKTGIFFPISFNYFISPYCSFGFIQKIGSMIGFIPYLHVSYIKEISPELSVSYMLGMKHKMGNPYKKYNFLLEYGAELYLNYFRFSHYVSTSGDNYSSTVYSTVENFTINLGPEIFIGYEYYKNKYSYENGFFLGCLFNLYSQQVNYYPIKINIGIEIRINKRFYNYYFKELKIN